MRPNLVFYTLLTVQASIGLWGLMQSGVLSLSGPQESQPPESAKTLRTNGSAPKISEHLGLETVPETPAQANREMDAGDIQALIRAGGFSQAANTINDRYSYLSRSDLEQLRQEFLNHAARASSGDRKDILIAASEVFDELDVWKRLANAAAREADWQLAFDSQLKASQLESDPIELNTLLSQLVKSSSYLRSAFEKNDDQLSIKTLYQGLADLHPQFGRFQLELAHSHARLGDFQSAKSLYTTLSYDPKFSDIARQALTKIDESQTAERPIATAQPQQERKRTSDIVVPLIAAGSSFLIDTDIDRQRSRLLLDTGASITALSSDLIKRLDLTPTGQSIRISTANGLTRARLYRVGRLSLGRLTLKNMVVAEIVLGRRGSFEGLLGTDALNQVKSQYNYIIDNQKNALIFRAR